MSVYRRLLVCLLIALAGGGLAWAHTVEELATWTNNVQSEMQTVAAQAQACPGGDCQARNQIEASYAAAEDDRLSLVAARQALGTCGTCTELDLQLADVSALSSNLGAVITAWEEQD